MNKRLIFILLLTLFNPGLNAQTTAAGSSQAKNTTGWQTYSNIQYGFSFQYPDTYTEYGQEANITDRSGSVVAISINFIDTVSHSTIFIEYHLAPKGAGLYEQALSQFKSSKGWYSTGASQLEVAGNNAIEAFVETHTGGKEGEILNPSLRLILVDFPDRQKTGEFNLQFNTPLPDDAKEVARFNQLLSTFKFAN